MTMKNSSEETEKREIPHALAHFEAHFEKYETSPLVRRVISQESTFGDEINAFYNRSKEDASNKGKYPVELVDILDIFSKTPLDREKLVYEKVREETRESIKMNYRIAILTGGGVAIAGGFAILVTPLTAPASIACGMGVALAIGGNMYYISRANKLSCEKEYQKMWGCAHKADAFMNQHYRIHFIRAKLYQ